MAPGIHLKAMSQGIPQASNTMICLKNIYLKFHLNFSGASDKKYQEAMVMVILHWCAAEALCAVSSIGYHGKDPTLFTIMYMVEKKVPECILIFLNEFGVSVQQNVRWATRKLIIEWNVLCKICMLSGDYWNNHVSLLSKRNNIHTEILLYPNRCPSLNSAFSQTQDEARARK